MTTGNSRKSKSSPLEISGCQSKEGKRQADKEGKSDRSWDINSILLTEPALALKQCGRSSQTRGESKAESIVAVKRTHEHEACDFKSWYMNQGESLQHYVYRLEEAINTLVEVLGVNTLVEVLGAARNTAEIHGYLS